MIAILDRNLKVINRVQPEKMPLNLEERKSTASIDLPIDAPEINFGAWLRDDTEPGKGIIWRVKSGGKQYDRKTKTIQLEHIINTLKDVLIFGELTPAGIAGNSSATTCTAENAARKVLSYQNIWVLGDFEYSVSNPYKFNGDSIYNALETITASLDGAYWDYDLSRLPFKLHIRRPPTSASCEMRTNRNIQTLRMTIDGSRMYTRFYPIGKEDKHITGDYVSRNENIYGTICRTETDQSKKTEAELRAWAEERIRNHCEPSVTVQISGLELSEATGEPLDKLTINRKCRVPLPEYGTVIEDKITKLSWNDKISEPEKVNVTLANLIEDVASIINSAAKAGARGGRASAKEAKEDHAWMVDTDTHVGLVAEAVAGEGAAQDWSRVASVMVDGEGIHQRVVKTEKDVVKAFTEIDLNDERIRLEARRATEAEGTLSGQIIVEADRITQEVTRAKSAEGTLSGRITVEADRITQEVTRAKSAEGTLSGRITVEADRISLVVSDTGSGATIKAAKIVTAINETGSEVAISADKVVLSGSTKINNVFTVISNAVGVSVPMICNGNVDIASNKVLNLYTATFQGSNPVSITAPTLAGVIKNASVSGNTLTLTPFVGEAINFSKATSLGGVWGSGHLEVTASPQNEKYHQYIISGDAEDTSADENSWYVPILAKSNPNEQSSTRTGHRVAVNATGRYNAGKTQGYKNAANAMGWPGSISGQSDKTSVSITYPNTSGGTSQRTLTLTKDSAGAYVKLGSSLIMKIS